MTAAVGEVRIPTPTDTALVALFEDVKVERWIPRMSGIGRLPVDEHHGWTAERMRAREAADRLRAPLPSDGRGLASDDDATVGSAVVCGVKRLAKKARGLGWRVVRDDHGVAIVTPGVVLLGYLACDGVIPLKRTMPGDDALSMADLLATSPDPHVKPGGRVAVWDEASKDARRVREVVLAALEIEPSPCDASPIQAHLAVDAPGFSEPPHVTVWDVGRRQRTCALATAALRATNPVGYRWRHKSPFVNRARSVAIEATRLAIVPTRQASALLRGVSRREALATLTRVVEVTGNVELRDAIDRATGRG